MDDRERLEEQTRRNIDGMELERNGRLDLALELYEQNVVEGFEGDWPYGRLVAYYEKIGRYDEAERVLNRAIDVFKASKKRSATDRRATVQVFRNRLRLVKKAAREAGRGRPRSFEPLPMADEGGTPPA
ncbi:MAG: tetratricopeptide repeat protein [Chloroflexota bacterium]|nr:tetratricopeptide repeat protein [Chloroflexota bacterium]